jgi:hypothetical protein
LSKNRFKREPRKGQTYIIIETTRDSLIVNARLEFSYGTPIPNLLNWDLNTEYKEGDQYFDFIIVGLSSSFI